MLSAGCHSSKRISAMSPLSSSQIKIGRAPVSIPRFRRTFQKSAPAAAKTAIASTQTGHGVKKTNWPLWKMLAGYLNRSSNMKSTSATHSERYRDVRNRVLSYRLLEFGGKLHAMSCPHLTKSIPRSPRMVANPLSRCYLLWSIPTRKRTVGDRGTAHPAPSVRRSSHLLYRAGILRDRSEEHTSELQSLRHLVCR